jgi:hypothetical protein
VPATPGSAAAFSPLAGALDVPAELRIHEHKVSGDLSALELAEAMIKRGLACPPGAHR